MHIIQINIDFEKLTKQNLAVTMNKNFIEQMFSSYTELENVYKMIGLKGILMHYQFLGDDLSEKDFLYLATDYVARVCWAFHQQGNKAIEYLKNYKKSFFDFKIGKSTLTESTDKLFDFESKFRSQSHGLVHLHGRCRGIFDEKKMDYKFWCDGLMVRESENVKNRIAIKYSFNQDYSIRGLLNPLKVSLFDRVQYIEHIESLNLVFALAIDKMKNDDKKIQQFIKIVDFAWDYFIDNRLALDTPIRSNDAVCNIINKFN